MAVGSQQFAATTAAQVIASVPPVEALGPMASVVVTTSANVYLGGSNVSSANGLALTSSSAPLTVTLYGGDVLYAVAATTATVSVLQT